jgi:hypothetical protein
VRLHVVVGQRCGLDRRGSIGITLPLTCTGSSTVSSTSSAGSATGNASWTSESVVAETRPQLFGDVRRERRHHEHHRLGGRRGALPRQLGQVRC